MAISPTVLSATLFVAGTAAINASQAENALEEIIVTSQWREQNINETPLSVTALSSDKLEQLNIQAPNDLPALTPGLSISAVGTTYTSYSIRGLSTDEPSAQSAPRVAVYLNGADISRNRSSQVELHDIERVEVIKGPQATLFGTTASAGAIAVYTKAPQQEKEIGIKFGLGNFNLNTLKAYATGGSEHLQGRIAISSKTRDGYQDNAINTEQRFGELNRQSIRGSLRWLQSENTQWDLVVTHEGSTERNAANKSATIAPFGGDTAPETAAATTGNPYGTALFPNHGLKSQRETNDINLRINHEWNDWTIHSISAYRDFDVKAPFDADGTQAWAFELLEQSAGHRGSQEIRFQQVKDNHSFTLGISYLKEQLERNSSFATDEGAFMLCVPFARRVFAPIYAGAAAIDPSVSPLATAIDLESGLPCINEDGSSNTLSPIATNGFYDTVGYYARLTDYGDNESLSTYIDWSQTIKQWQFDIGGRYIHEKRRSGFQAIVPNALLTGGLYPLQLLQDTGGERINAGNTDDAFLPRASISFEWLDKHIAYIAYSEGRRSAVTDITATLDGSFQPVANPVTQIPAEKLRNYEFGFKGTAERFNYQISLFEQQYSDFQVSFLSTNAGGQFVIENVGDTTNTGAEAEINWQVSDAVTLFTNASHIDNTFDNSVNNAQFSGKALVHTPDTTATAGLIYKTTMAKTPITASLYGNYRSEVYFDPFRQPRANMNTTALKQDGYTVWNGSLSVELPNAMQLRFWMNNITDENYLLDASSLGSNLGMPTTTVAEPRTFGVDLSLTL